MRYSWRSGAFVRKDAIHHARSEPGGRHPPERDRYYPPLGPLASVRVALSVLGLKGAGTSMIGTQSYTGSAWRRRSNDARCSGHVQPPLAPTATEPRRRLRAFRRRRRI